MKVDRGVYRVREGERIFHPMKTTNDALTGTTWTVDPLHTTVGFSVRHLMMTNVRGDFEKPGGRVRYDERAPENTEIEAEIQAVSIHTRFAPRDEHLRGPDFFDTATHPSIVFRSTGARVASSGALEVKGNLTMRGVTRDATMVVSEITGIGKDHNGATKRGASATMKIKRSDFGMTYNKVLEAGGVAIADDVTLTLDIALVKDGAG